MTNRLIQLEQDIHRTLQNHHKKRQAVSYQFGGVPYQGNKKLAHDTLNKAYLAGKSQGLKLFNSNILKFMNSLVATDQKKWNLKSMTIQRPTFQKKLVKWLIKDKSNKEATITATLDAKKTVLTLEVDLSYGKALVDAKFIPPKNLKGYQPFSKLSKQHRDIILGICDAQGKEYEYPEYEHKDYPPYKIIEPEKQEYLSKSAWGDKTPAQYLPKHITAQQTKGSIHEDPWFQNYILATHNEVRRIAWKTDHNLAWNKTLAKLAQLWAERLIYDQGNGTGREYHRSEKYRRGAPHLDDIFGENKYCKGGDNPPFIKSVIDGAINDWYETEFDLYYSDATTAYNKEIYDAAHYLNMTWKSTRFVGAGMACRKKDGKYLCHVVCHYWPSRTTISGQERTKFMEETPQQKPSPLNANKMWIFNS
ncbi:MAG: CAP domain-containing protein [Cyanobacteria bacterium J06635_15]